MEVSLQIREMGAGDWLRVHEIYLDGIATGQATFQTEPIEWEAWNSSHLDCCRLVAEGIERGGGIVAWAALSPVSSRSVYRGVAEVSIYVAASERGKGLGRKLLMELVHCSERAGIWTLQAAIFPENGPSVRVHQACGFRVVGVRERLGSLRGVWRDVLLLERRSSVAGN